MVRPKPVPPKFRVVEASPHGDCPGRLINLVVDELDPSRMTVFRAIRQTQIERKLGRDFFRRRPGLLLGADDVAVRDREDNPDGFHLLDRREHRLASSRPGADRRDAMRCGLGSET